MRKQHYSNTGILARFLLRQDRVRISVWLISIFAITIAVAIAFNNLYATEGERQAIAETMRNPAMTAMVGQGYGLDNYTSGAMMAHQMLLFTAIAVAIMNILLVTRHTRADEEDGRTELVRSLPTGRLSHLSATICIMTGTNLVLALLIGFGLYALGIESMNLNGSLLYGAALGAIGIFFMALAAVFAQLTENARGTIGFSFAALCLDYLLRAIGDVSNEALSWLSPLKWVLETEAYVNNYWWPIVFTIGISLIFAIFAFYLNSIRDLGSGFIRTKSGKKHASRLLQRPIGLAFRIQRTGLIAWAIGMYILGASYGSVLGDLESFFKDVEMMQELLTPVDGFSLTEQFITMLMSVLAMICTIPTLMAMLKLTSEERKNRTEHMLSRAVSRNQLMGSYFAISVITSFVMLSLTVLGLWSAGIAVMDEAISFETFYRSAIVYLPAIWMMIGISVLLIGLAPKITSLVWGYLIYSFIVVYLGGLLQFPEWMGNLSPYGHIPKLPVEDVDFLKISFLTIIAMIIAIIGFLGYKKRDIWG